MALMFAGIDIGSASTKAILMADSQIISYHIIPSGSDFAESSQVALDEALNKSNSAFKDIAGAVTTGYGRYITEINAEAVTEITCAARGASFLCADTKAIVDIGGQDTKVIKIGKGGRVLDFVLNDKCAAGTGRFIERIATSLGLGLDEFAARSVGSMTKLPISSTCTVFAETEVISRISKGESLDGIIRGVHSALAARIYGLAQRLKIQEAVVACGGGALNAGLMKELRDLTGDITLPPTGIDPRLLPAIGAALIATERYALNPVKHSKLSRPGV
ncbi:MAG TPA: 2-hydroxyglutaryl-CoA dehydratase [Dehalococcoidia bacterium]|nr:2-hydroxyglutaryl-CoA dehydratase [Dehalococcoidia bacterium]